MTRLIIFPFFRETIPLIYSISVELYNKIHDIEIYGIIPESISSPGQNSTALLNYPIHVNVRLISPIDLHKYIDNCIFLELPYLHSNANEFFVNRITTQLEYTKIKIYNSPIEALSACGINDSNNLFNVDEFNKSRPEIKLINIPVIGVCGVFPLLATALITSKLKEHLSKELVVSTIYTSEIHKNWGYNYIDIKAIESLSFENRVFYINMFVNNVIKRESSEIVVVEIPHAVMGLDSQQLLGGGEYPFIFTQALDFDYSICCVPINNSDSLSFSKLDHQLRSKYGMRYISYHLTNQHLFFERDMYNGSIQYMLMNENYVSKKMNDIRANNHDLHIYNFMETDEIEKWANSISTMND